MNEIQIVFRMKIHFSRKNWFKHSKDKRIRSNLFILSSIIRDTTRRKQTNTNEGKTNEFEELKQNYEQLRKVSHDEFSFTIILFIIL